jgi:hypothetical protein
VIAMIGPNASLRDPAAGLPVEQDADDQSLVD